MSVDAAGGEPRDHWSVGKGYAREATQFYLTQRLVKQIADHFFPDYNPRIKEGVCLVGSYVVTRLNYFSIPILLLSLLMFQNQAGEAVEEEKKEEVISHYWIKVLPKVKIEEGIRSQVVQLAAALKGIEKSHAVVIHPEDKEVDNIVRQLPHLPQFENYTIVKWTGRSSDRAGLESINRYLQSNPQTIVYVPFGYLASHFLDRLPQETCIVVGMPSYHIWNEFKSVDIIRYKEVKLKPLNREQCLEILQIKIPLLGTECENRFFEAAVELAFLLNVESGKELSIAKDLIERTLNEKSSGVVSIVDLWSVFEAYYTVAVENHKYAIHGNFALAPHVDAVSQALPSLDEIAGAMNKKFSLTLERKASIELLPPSYLVDLNEKTKEMPLFAVGNERRVKELTRALKGLDKTNALLIGVPGTGKTTLVESIAWQVSHDEVDEKSFFFGKTIYSLDINKMSIGTKWVGMPSERVSELFKFLSGRKDVILFIDEIQQLIGAGASTNNEMGSYAQLMKPYLLAQGITVIGATTPGEYERWIQTDTTAAFGRRFREIKVQEPTEDECVEMLEHVTQSDLFKEAYPGVHFDEGSIQLAVHLMGKVESRIGDPDKTKDFIEKMATALENIEEKTISPEEVEKYFSQHYKDDKLKDKEVVLST